MRNYLCGSLVKYTTNMGFLSQGIPKWIVRAITLPRNILPIYIQHNCAEFAQQ